MLSDAQDTAHPGQTGAAAAAAATYPALAGKVNRALQAAADKVAPAAAEAHAAAAAQR
jgi:hypothetical protein